jgi:diadenosine tetraphosphate (Ap4A) HIT family hydrolase
VVIAGRGPVVTAELCPFCRISNGDDPTARIVYEDADTVAFFPTRPATRGHTLVVPRRHVEDVMGLTAADAEAVTRTVLVIARGIRNTLHPNGLNIIQSNGAAATQTVDHVHVHVVPRWRGDRLRLRWPRRAAEDGQRLDRTLTDLQGGVKTSTHVVGAPAPDPEPPSPEVRQQHLGFIQEVITRMSQASAAAKTWLLPIMMATYGYALVHEDGPVALLGLGSVFTFGLLDANYLKQEKAFRRLYDAVAGGHPIPQFSMNPTLAAPSGGRSNYWPDWDVLKSWAIAPVYLPLVAAGLVIAAIGFFW